MPESPDGTHFSNTVGRVIAGRLYAVYFDQILDAGRTQKLVKTLFWAVFNLFVNFNPFLVISQLKKTSENEQKK